ncbi:M48 family metallopeptidase, partial [Ameyamaea chiangmaiensis]
PLPPAPTARPRRLSPSPSAQRTNAGRSPDPMLPETIALATEAGALTTRVTWRRSPRARRITLRIDPSGTGIVVTLPIDTPVESGLTLVRTHGDWIARRLASMPAVVPVADGGSVMLDGVAHAVRHRTDARRGVWLEAEAIHVSGDVAFLSRRVREFLMREARARLSGRVQTAAQGSGLTPRALVLRDTRSRWGSCSDSGQVMLCWRLVMAPVWVQEYVIVHELAHLRHFDHGVAFWALVERLCDRRREAEHWLRRNGAALLRAV